MDTTATCTHTHTRFNVATSGERAVKILHIAPTTSKQASIIRIIKSSPSLLLRCLSSLFLRDELVLPLDALQLGLGEHCRRH